MVNEFEGFRGNFHNRYGIYVIRGLFFTTVYWETVCNLTRIQGSLQFVSKEHAKDVKCSSNQHHGWTSLSLDERV